jgi:hypothetical protein
MEPFFFVYDLLFCRCRPLASFIEHSTPCLFLWPNSIPFNGQASVIRYFRIWPRYNTRVWVAFVREYSGLILWFESIGYINRAVASVRKYSGLTLWFESIGYINRVVIIICNR